MVTKDEQLKWVSDIPMPPSLKVNSGPYGFYIFCPLTHSKNEFHSVNNFRQKEMTWEYSN